MACAMDRPADAQLKPTESSVQPEGKRDAGACAYLLNRLTGGLAEDLIDIVAQPHELARLVVDVRGLPACRARWMVQHDARVRQRIPLPLHQPDQPVLGLCDPQHAVFPKLPSLFFHKLILTQKKGEIYSDDIKAEQSEVSGAYASIR